MKNFFIRTSSPLNHSFIRGWFSPSSKFSPFQNDWREREEEIQTGAGDSGVEDMEFPGVLKKYHVEILGVKWKSGIFRGDQEIMLHFHESWFLTLDFSRGVTQFYRIYKAKRSFVLSRISKSKVTNLKDPVVFFLKKYDLNPPFGFFWNSPTIISYLIAIVQILTNKWKFKFKTEN